MARGRTSDAPFDRFVEAPNTPRDVKLQRLQLMVGKVRGGRFEGGEGRGGGVGGGGGGGTQLGQL